MDKELFESKRIQLQQLQSRIGLHGTRLWQLPLTYLGGIALGLTAAGSEKFFLNWGMLFSLLTVLGFIFLYCLSGAYEGYKRTAKAMNEVESELGLTTWTKCHHLHRVPYWLLMIFGIVICLGAAAYSYENPDAFNSPEAICKKSPLDQSKTQTH